MARTPIGKPKQRRAAKKSIKAYAGAKGKASKNIMKTKKTKGGGTVRYGYKKSAAKTGRYKKQKPTTKVGRRSLKKK